LPPPKQNPTAAIGLGHECIECGCDAPPPLRCIAAQCIGKRGSFVRPGKAFAAAEHVGHEADIVFAAHHLGSPDGLVTDAQPVRRHQQKRTPAADLLVIYQPAAAGDVSGLIVNRFARHAVARSLSSE
jgi:hypothetical protein